MALTKVVEVQLKASGNDETQKILKALVGSIDDVTKASEALQDSQVEAQQKTQDEIAKTADAFAKQNKAIKGGKKPLRAIAIGFKNVGRALKTAGIGLVIGLFVGLKNELSSNQRVADAFNTVLETTSIVFSQVTKALVSVYDSVKSNKENFNGLAKVLGGLLNIYITPLKLAFYGIKLGIEIAQLTWEESFFGGKDEDKIKKLQESIDKTKEDIIEIGEKAAQSAVDIYENFAEAAGEISSISKTATEELGKVSVNAAKEQAKTNVQARNDAKLAAAQQQLLIEKYDQQAEQLRQVRDEERLSIDARKVANDELGRVLEEQQKAMLAQADLQVRAAQLEVNKNNTIENQVALTEALANKQGVLAQIEGFRSEQKANDLALDKEAVELQKSKGEAESELSLKRKQFNAEQISDELLKLEALKEIDLQEQELESARLQRLIDNAAAGTQAKIDAQIALDTFNEESRQKNITRDQEIADAETTLAKQKIRDKAMVVDAISQFANAETGIGKALLIAKQALALQETLMDVKRITFKGKQAIGESLVNSSQNISESSKIGFPQNLITIAAAIGQGIGIISSVKKAVSKTGAATGGVGASTPSIPTPALPPSRPPSFNIVGSTGTNQLAEVINSQTGQQTDAITGAIGSQTETQSAAIAEQYSQPIKAYVVGSEVSGQQELDRKTEDEANIG